MSVSLPAGTQKFNTRKHVLLSLLLGICISFRRAVFLLKYGLYPQLLYFSNTQEDHRS